jgi:hypothetical protein
MSIVIGLHDKTVGGQDLASAREESIPDFAWTITREPQPD